MTKMKLLAPLLLLTAASPSCSLPAPQPTGGDDGGMTDPSALCNMVGTGGSASTTTGTGGNSGTAAGGSGSGDMSSGSGGTTFVSDQSAGGAGGAGGAAGASATAGATGTAGSAGTAGAGGSSNTDPNTIVTPVSCGATNAVALPYTPGYTPDPVLQGMVQSTVNSMTLSDEAAQMRGLAITAFNHPTNDIQRSEDTGAIRGFRYRDASRGMDLGEDFLGTYPNAGTVAGSPVGYSTAFPVSMARGAAFDLDLEYAIGEAIGDEMQAAHETLLLAPCMNLLRNPLWGRAQETYGEDSFHIGRLATALAVGIQKHVLADAKHYMAYDVENGRPGNNANLDEQTLRETFGRHFRMVVQDSGVGSVMASYNLVNGIKATENYHILTEVLRNDFGFKGFILSDWWAMTHGSKADTDATLLKATAVEGVKAGLDVELPWGLNYGQLENIVTTGGGLTKNDIDTSVKRILEQKFRFNAQNLSGPYGLPPGASTIFYNDQKIICDGPHIALAEKAAVESMVLLKNDNSTLPIPASVTKVAVVGATVNYKVTDGATQNGDATRTIDFSQDVVTGDLGSSRVFPDPAKSIGPYAGIQMTAPSGVTVVRGNSASDVGDADFVVVMAGLTPEDEGEEYTGAGDRQSLALDAKQPTASRNKQNDLINAVIALHKPMVVVLEGGSVIDMPWLNTVPAVVMAWYPGMVGGVALGKLLFGAANFGGKLPFTWASLGDYPPFGGTGSVNFDYYAGYRWFDAKNMAPILPFGYGLSYTTFSYTKLQLGCTDIKQGGVLPVVVNVKNTGSVAGDEIVMVFVSFPDSKAARRSVKELKGFQRVSLAPGEEKQVTIPVRLADLDYFQTDSANPSSGKWVVESGNIKISVGGSATNLPLTATLPVTGY
jgi:beta-glucosidase